MHACIHLLKVMVLRLESYFKLKYIEYLEFLCRLAYSANLVEVWMCNGKEVEDPHKLEELEAENEKDETKSQD